MAQHRILARISACLLAGWVGTCVHPAMFAEGQPVPERVEGRREIYFFATSSLSVKEGLVTGLGLPEILALTLESYLKLEPTAGCIRLFPFERESDPVVPRASLIDATRHSEGVLLGRVTGLRSGFRSTGEGGTLIQVEAQKVLRGRWLGERTVFHVFAPVGRFDFGGRQFCAEGPGWARLPEEGDAVLLFLPYRGWCDESFLELYDAAGLVVLRKDGSADPPVRYLEGRGGAAASAAEVEKIVTEAARELADPP